MADKPTTTSATPAGGRPPLVPETEAEKAHAATLKARDQAAIIKQQRKDCERLASAIEVVGSLPDYGAGVKGSPSAALGQIARATQTLHELQREAFDLGKKGAQIRAVIKIPALSLSIEAWETESAQVIPEARALPPDPNAGRHIEDPIQGQPNLEDTGDSDD